MLRTGRQVLLIGSSELLEAISAPPERTYVLLRDLSSSRRRRKHWLALSDSEVGSALLSSPALLVDSRVNAISVLAPASTLLRYLGPILDLFPCAPGPLRERLILFHITGNQPLWSPDSSAPVPRGALISDRACLSSSP